MSLHKFIPFAKHIESGKLTSIEDVESGENCKCICLYCETALIAKKGEIKRHHFAHKNKKECAYGFALALHERVQQVLSNTSEIAIPEHPGYAGWIYTERQKTKISSIRSELLYHKTIPTIIIQSGIGEFTLDIFCDKRIQKEKEFTKVYDRLEINLRKPTCSRELLWLDEDSITNIYSYKTWRHSNKEPFLPQKTVDRINRGRYSLTPKKRYTSQRAIDTSPQSFESALLTCTKCRRKVEEGMYVNKARRTCICHICNLEGAT